MSSMPGASDVRMTDASSLSGFSSSRTCRRRKLLRVRMRDECQRQSFVVSERQSPLPECRIHLRARQLHHGAAVGGQRVRELVVPVQPRDLFDHIDLALHIQPPAGNVHAKLRIVLPLGNERESEAASAMRRSVPGPDCRPECAAPRSHAARPEPDPSSARSTSTTSPTSSPPPDSRIIFATRSHDSTVDSKSAPRSKRCDASVCNPVPPGHLAHNARIPPRRLDHDVSRLLRDHRVVSAHDAGEADWFLRVAHDQIFRRELALHAVERLQRLSRCEPFRTMICPPSSRSRSNTCVGLPISHRT